MNYSTKSTKGQKVELKSHKGRWKAKLNLALAYIL